MKKSLTALLLVAALLAPAASVGADVLTMTIKVGKIRVKPHSDTRGFFRFGMVGDRAFDGCTVDTNYMIAFANQAGGDDPLWQLLLEAKRANLDLGVYYAVNVNGRCAMSGLELP